MLVNQARDLLQAWRKREQINRWTDGWMDKTDDKWLSKDREQSQAKRDVGSGYSWLSVNSTDSQRMKVTTVEV